MTIRSVAQAVAVWFVRIVARMAGVILVHIRCHGREYVPEIGGAILCSNHQSFLDPVLVGLACDRRLSYLARDTLFRNPWFGGLLRFFDTISIQRDRMGVAGFRETSLRLQQGAVVLVFPEGTRTTDGEIGTLHTGVCRLARRASVPLIPMAIEGAYQAWPRHAAWPRPTTIHVWFGPPIPVEEVERLTDQQLLQQLEIRMRAIHARAQRGRRQACLPGYFCSGGRS